MEGRIVVRNYEKPIDGVATTPGRPPERHHASKRPVAWMESDQNGTCISEKRLRTGVGWVEHSDTHRPIREPLCAREAGGKLLRHNDRLRFDEMGFAALDPSCESTLYTEVRFGQDARP